jgi:hypothetical protein
MLAAERSLKTNLALGLFFLTIISCIAFVANAWRPYFTLIALSAMKGALPIMTTIANFGTVKTIVSQYCDYAKQMTMK